MNDLLDPQASQQGGGLLSTAKNFFGSPTGMGLLAAAALLLVGGAGLAFARRRRHTTEEIAYDEVVHDAPVQRFEPTAVDRRAEAQLRKHLLTNLDLSLSGKVRPDHFKPLCF